MVDEVISGGQQIASEATLQRLLDAISGSTDSSAAVKVKQLAESAGRSKKSLDDLDTSYQQVAANLTKFAGSVLEGTASSSQLVGAFSGLKGTTGLVAAAFAKLIAIQEQNFAAYQGLSASGVNFAGSLTELRNAAAGSFLSLDQFSSLLKSNSSDLISLGGTVNEGAKRFATFSNSVLTSDVGTKILGLGYSTEEANQALLSYVAVSGVRNVNELKNNQKLIESSGQYLEELDRMAQITGKTRQEMEESMKKEKLKGDEALTIARMAPEERAAFKLQMKFMTDKFGDAGRDMALAQAQGRSVITKGGQMLSAVAPGMQKAYAEMDDARKKFGVGSVEYQKAQQKVFLAAQEGVGKLPSTVATAGAGMDALGTTFSTVSEQMEAGLTTEQAFEDQRKNMEAERKKRADSEATSMAESLKGFKELGAAVMNLLSPVVKLAGWVAGLIGNAASGIAGAVNWFNQLTSKMGTFGEVLKGAIVIIAGGLLMKGAGGAVGGVASAASGALGGVAKTAGSLAGSVGGAAGAAGGGFVGFIRSLGMGLASLAPVAVPMVIGATAVAATIGILGAGVAAAIALIGLGLPVFAKGLKDIAEIDGIGLGKVALALAILGPSLVLFSGSMIAAGLMTAGSKILNFFTGGGPISQIQSTVKDLTPMIPAMEKIGPALNNYAAGIVAFGKAVSTVDLGKAERLKEVMKGPGVLEGIGSAIKDVGAATAKLMTSNTGGQEKSGLELATLNSSIRELIRVSKEISDYTKQTVEVTKKLNGDHFA